MSRPEETPRAAASGRESGHAHEGQDLALAGERRKRFGPEFIPLNLSAPFIRRPVATTLLTIASSALVAYGFARFNFPFKKQLFAILIATLMLPNSVIIIPRYVLFNKFGWVDSYMPFWVPALLACYPFFIYQLIQFMRGIPRDLDESACIDGCGTFRIFWQILLPLMKPALFSAGLFQFLWTYNDYFNSLIFINSVKKYTISLALRLSVDAESVVVWGRVMAMACVAVLPLVLLFFAAQKYFVEGIATSGLKG
ncbi:carbohydrate ABC transporter permease [Desulfovibrio sp.]|uniref:carbohydrate ABC transporter permease n=1 Tax=Desulfovibrio sp. TaxID=885 RepID=UPI003AAC0071